MGALGQRLRKHAFSAIAGQLFPEVLRYLVANPGQLGDVRRDPPRLGERRMRIQGAIEFFAR